MNQVPLLASGIPVYCAHHAVVQIDELKPHPSNPRRHPEKQLVVYAQVIKSNGWRQSVIVSKRSGFVVSGHGAVEAARKMGATECPVSYQDYATEAEELADLLAQNRLAELGKTDGDALKAVLMQLQSTDAITGYSPGDLDKMLEVAGLAPQYPITSKLNERHDFVLIYVDSETDWQFLKNLAGIRTEASYKNKNVGEGRALPLSRFLTSLRENLHSIPQTGDVHDDAPAAN